MKITFVDLQVSYWYTENDNCEHFKFSHADNNDKKKYKYMQDKCLYYKLQRIAAKSLHNSISVLVKHIQ
jgi:hypothetical protein